MAVTGSGDLEQLLAAVELSRRPGVGAKTFKKLVERYGTPAQASAAHPHSLRSSGATAKSPLTEAQRHALSRLSPKIGFTYLGAADYPKLLELTSEPPPYLFRVGPLWPLPKVAVAIVGPRRCTPQAEAFAKALAARLAGRGVLIVSGGARGVDSAAHRGALEVVGTTALVAATGIDRRYPRENGRLHELVVEGGCVLTELLPGTPPRRDFFPTRNRILVGLCHATIIVEGSRRSGTATSASHALKLGRPLFTWRRSQSPSLRETPDDLIERGAAALDEPDERTVLSSIEAWLQRGRDV